VYLRETGSRTDQQIKTLSADGMRNIVIVELDRTVEHCQDNLQGYNNLKLVSLLLNRIVGCEVLH